jgi:hypothetical protein
VQHQGTSWQTRIVRRSIIWLQTCTVVEQALLLIVSTQLVSNPPIHFLSYINTLTLTLCKGMMSRQLELHKLNTGRECRVQMAATKLVNFLFQYGGYIGAYLIIGGYDVNGPHLVSISAHGKYANLLFASFFIFGFVC